MSEYANTGDLVPTQANWNSQEGLQARVNLCQNKIRDALKEFDCGFRVDTLHIGTGRIIPEIQIVPNPPVPRQETIFNPKLQPKGGET